jgi:hypothetical protein
LVGLLVGCPVGSPVGENVVASVQFKQINRDKDKNESRRIK